MHETIVQPRGNLSMGEYLLRLYETTSRPLSCTAQNEQEWRHWRAAFESKLRELMAPWPQPCPLDPILLDSVQLDGYRREKVLFHGEQEMAIPAYVLIPDAYDGSMPLPALICQHGHGHGKDDSVGLTHGSYSRYQSLHGPSGLHYDFAPNLARRGYVVTAMDARGWGERADGYEPDGAEGGCNMMQLRAQLLGLNLLTLNVFDVTRCIDYLLSRPEVDPERIGCLGLSYGGTLTLFASALDERIRCAVVSGYLSSLHEQSLVRGDTCGSQIVPGLLRWAELSDVASLIAPRALLIESATEDPMFGIQAARAAYGRVRRLYEVLNVPERVAQHVFEGGHRWDGALTDEWLARWL